MSKSQRDDNIASLYVSRINVLKNIIYFYIIILILMLLWIRECPMFKVNKLAILCVSKKKFGTLSIYPLWSVFNTK